jgi:aspartate/methionine/tyrosine aminotransferase
LNRYSERLPWSTPQNAYSALLEQKRLAGDSLLDLSCSNPTQALPNYPHAEIAHAFGAIADFQYEPQALGAPRARDDIAHWYAQQGIVVSGNRIALCASTSEAYSILFKLLCNPGDEVLIPNPSYPLLEYLAQAEAVKTAPYRLFYEGGWFIDLDSVRNAISARTKAVVLVNPNNPTGSFVKAAELDALSEIAVRYELSLISDEVFMTYPVSGVADRVRSLIGHDEILSFSLNGLSKTAGMPQMKLGWMVVNGPEEEARAALGKLELLLDTYLSVGTPVQRALPSLFSTGDVIHSQIGERLRRNGEALAALERSPIQTLVSEAGWSAILRVPAIRTEEAWMTSLLIDHGIVVQPGYFFDMATEAYLVVSLLSNPEQFAAGLTTLKQLAER